jgi:uncharacterized protein YecA (UPF0149 family)
VARDFNNLGSVHYKLGDNRSAKKCFERAYQICKQLLGEEHPHTILARENFESVSGGPTPMMIEKKVGRNDPCPCGSGKKYKKCHGM